MGVDKVKALLRRGRDEYLCLEKEREWVFYDFPGGSFEDYDPDVEGCLLRELDEELSFLDDLDQVNEITPVPYYKAIDANEARNVYPFYIEVKSDYEPVVSDEHSSYSWLGEEELRNATLDETLTNYRLLFFEYTRKFKDEKPSKPPVFEENKIPGNIEDILDTVE